MRYEVRINGQEIGSLEEGDIERRASVWQKANANVEVIDVVTHVSVSLSDFLAQTPKVAAVVAQGAASSLPSRPQSAGLLDQFDSLLAPGHFEVRVNGQVLGVLGAPDVIRRSKNWGGMNVEVSSPLIGVLSLDAWLKRMASRFEPLLWPSSPDSKQYTLRINGQVAAQGLSRAEIEWRAAHQLIGAGSEVGASGGSYVSLADFVANKPVVSPAPPPPTPTPQLPLGATKTPLPQVGPGPYFVRINGQLLGPLSRIDIEKRSQRWLPARVEVAELSAGPFAEIDDFLRMPVAPAPAPVLPPPLPSPQISGPQPALKSPVAVAALTLITLNFYWLYWLANTYKRIRQLNPNATKITPGKAVGFLFIPIFGALWFIWIAFSLPRATVRAGGPRADSHRFACAAAGVMCLMGSLWPWGFALPMLSAQIAWIAGCEILFLGFIAYCQAMLNSAAFAAAGGPARSRPRGVLATAAGLAAASAMLGFFASPRDVTPILERAHQLAASGDFEAAARELQVNAPEAKYELAFLYKNGLGVKQDSERAVALLREAAEAGLPDAQTALGLCYATGDGVQPDPITAITWYRKAAAQSDNNGAILLGLAYAAGNGVEQDPGKAYMWFTVAANRGDPYAASEKTVAANVLTDPAQKERAEKEAAEELQREAGGQR